MKEKNVNVPKMQTCLQTKSTYGLQQSKLYNKRVKMSKANVNKVHA